MASKGDFKVPTLCRPANIWHRNKRFSFTLLIAVSLVLSHLPVTDFSLSVFNILSLCLKFVFSSLTFSFCISLLLSGYKHIDFFSFLLRIDYWHFSVLTAHITFSLTWFLASPSHISPHFRLSFSAPISFFVCLSPTSLLFSLLTPSLSFSIPFPLSFRLSGHLSLFPHHTFSLTSFLTLFFTFSPFLPD